MINRAHENWTNHDSQRLPTAEYSILQSSPAFVMLAVAIACGNNIADPDLWMHILGGKQIMRIGHVALRDFYSYSAAGLRWRDHEWLAQVILALSYNALGVFGLRIVKFVCAAITMSALALGLSWTGALPRVQRLVLLAAALGV